MDLIKIGKFIAQLRKGKGLTQVQLADMIGVSDKTISKWERGNGLPDVSLMLPLCGALEINVNELLTGERLIDADYKKKAEDSVKVSTGPAQSPKGRTKTPLQTYCFARLKDIQVCLSYR